MHRCMAANGTAYMLDRPCPAGWATPEPPKLRQYGSPSGPVTLDESRPYSRPQAPLPHHQFLGIAACKDLSEAVRTASARGLGAEGVLALQTEWQGRCADDDAMARKKYAEHQSAQQWQAQETRRLAEASLLARKTAQQERLERCAELRRILAQRRERTDLSPGEQTDLQRFEANYKTQCAN